MHKSYMPWRRTHTGFVDTQVLPLSAEYEPARKPAWCAYYEFGKTDPTWIETFPGGLQRVGVAREDVSRHGAVAHLL